MSLIVNTYYPFRIVVEALDDYGISFDDCKIVLNGWDTSGRGPRWGSCDAECIRRMPDNLRYICQLSASFLPQWFIRAEAAYKAGLYDASHPNRHSWYTHFTFLDETRLILVAFYTAPRLLEQAIISGSSGAPRFQILPSLGIAAREKLFTMKLGAKTAIAS